MPLDSSHGDQLRAASLIILLGMLGVAINAYVIYAVVRHKPFGQSFGAICISQMIATCGNSFMFAVFVGPITVIDVHFHATYAGGRIGQVLMIFWNASLFSHLLTAINRFVNLYFPYKYEAIFSKTVTAVAIAMVWTVSIAQGVPYFWSDCTLQFDVRSFTFGFVASECGRVIGQFLDLYLSITVVGVIALIDFVSFLKIRQLQTSGLLQAKAKDIKFFFQAWVQAMASITELVVYFWVAPMVNENMWLHFCLTTVCWMTVELVDGLAVILFNVDMRKCVSGAGKVEPLVLSGLPPLPLKLPESRVHELIIV